jgi:hypothetical protein
VASAVAQAKDSGILDFHRVSPLPASVVTVGFLFGAPIREYLLYAVTLPFAAACAAWDGVGLVLFLQIVVVQLGCAWVLHALALVTGLMVKKARGASGSAVALVVGLMLLSNALTPAGIYGPALLSPVPIYYEVIEAQQAIRDERAAREVRKRPQDPWNQRQQVREERLVREPPTFFGARLPVCPLSLLFQGSILAFLLIAGTRKMRSDRAHPYSKASALAFLVTLAVLMMGSVWPRPEVLVVLPSVYFLTVAASSLAAAVTPSAGEYDRGLQRARRLGWSRLPPWQDLASNRGAVLVFALVLVLAVAGTLLAAPLPPPDFFGRNPPPFVAWPSIAVGALTVLAYGLGMQFFELRLQKSGAMYFRLLLFLAWVAPIVLGAIMLATTGGDEVGLYIMDLSPLVGITMSALTPKAASASVMQLAALMPVGLMAVFFAAGLLLEERKAEQDVRERKLIEIVPVEPIDVDEDEPRRGSQDVTTRPRW